MKIRTKLMLLNCQMGVLIVAVAVYGMSWARSIDSSFRTIIRDDTTATASAAAVGMHFNQGRSQLLAAVYQTDMGQRNELLKEMQESDKGADQELEALKAKAVSEEGKQSIGRLMEQVNHYRAVRRGVFQDNSVNYAALNASEAEAKEISKQLAAIFQLGDVASTKHIDELTGSINAGFWAMGIGSLLVVIVAITVAFRLSGMIAKRLEIIVDEVEDIANGDFTRQTYIRNDDEIGLVASNLEKMRLKLQEAILDIHVAAEQVAAGAKNVSDASVSLSQGAAEQASAVEELSSSIAEISSQTRSNADNSDKANSLTVTATDFAKAGNDDMQDMLKAMEEINNSSTNISKIIKVIDEIAFQTNILALNAAVEAARAGQHGKGFAVVAEEVRNLAARSAKAAKETTDMIEDSISKVTEGRNIAQKTAEALGNIVTNISDVAEIVGSINKASREQSMALDQINQGILQVSQVVQSNSATSEESASASEELSAQAERLKETAGRFKLDVSSLPQQGITVRQQTAVKPAATAPFNKPVIALTEEEGFGKY